jgi:hypothetical protein
MAVSVSRLLTVIWLHLGSCTNLSPRLNCVVNLNGNEGKFIAIDEFNEWIVRAVKDVYNGSGTFQSTKFTCDVISPNVIPLHQASHKVLHSSGAPTYGYKHARVDDQRDVKAIVSHLLEQKVFKYSPGRDISTDKNLRAIPATDLYSAGVDELNVGDVLDRYVQAKLAHSAGAAGTVLEPKGGESAGADGGPEGLFGYEEPIWSFDQDEADGSALWDWD